MKAFARLNGHKQISNTPPKLTYNTSSLHCHNHRLQTLQERGWWKRERMHLPTCPLSIPNILYMSKHFTSSYRPSQWRWRFPGTWRWCVACSRKSWPCRPLQAARLHWPCPSSRCLHTVKLRQRLQYTGLITGILLCLVYCWHSLLISSTQFNLRQL